MPENHDCQDSRLAKYEAMSDDALRQLLREDASKPEGEARDTAVLLCVMEVLAKRRKERNEARSPEEALKTFKTKYNTENETLLVSESTPAAPKGGGWKRGLAAATAAVLVLIIGGAITARAFGYDPWQIIARWTQETFHFGNAGQTGETNDPSPAFVNPCASLQEALDINKVSMAIAPTWLPDGYIETDVRVTESPTQRSYTAKYENGDQTIRIRIADYLNGDPAQIEQSDSLIEIYTCNGVDYYIFNNYDQVKAVWINGHYECYIIGPVSLSEIKEVIDSIGKG